MRRLLMTLSALALAGCAYAPPKTGQTAALHVTNATDYSWSIHIDGRRAGSIGPGQTLAFRVGPGVHRVQALDRLYTLVYNRKRIVDRVINLGHIYSPNQKVDFLIAHYETRWDVLLMVRSASGGGPRPVDAPAYPHPPLHPE